MTGPIGNALSNGLEKCNIPLLGRSKQKGEGSARQAKSSGLGLYSSIF